MVDEVDENNYVECATHTSYATRGRDELQSGGPKLELSLYNRYRFFMLA